MLQDPVSPECAGRPAEAAGEDKLSLSAWARFRVPIGAQEVELLQLDYAHGGMSLLRVRIREGKRFTVFDLDPVTAGHWGELLSRWARAQPAGESMSSTTENC